MANPGGNPIDDPTSPYYIHHSSNPGISIVSQTLTGVNYAAWRRSMEIFLSAKNKLGFVNGDIKKPENADPELEAAWVRNNKTLISWILNSVSKEIGGSILYLQSAQEIWTDLKNRFQQRNGPKEYQLRQELAALKQGQNSISTYYTQMKSIWEALGNFTPACFCRACTCGGVLKILPLLTSRGPSRRSLHGPAAWIS